ncbi:proline hydroxylase, partial [Streptomyces lunaelactis]|nr:proline hydroxylase [Streptomyces lunaelactis]
MIDTTHLEGRAADRVAAGDWDALTEELNEYGNTLT